MLQALVSQGLCLLESLSEMKLFHYVVLHQFTLPCVQRIEFVLKIEGGWGMCWNKWIFFQYLLALLFVHAGVDSPFSIPTQVEI